MWATAWVSIFAVTSVTTRSCDPSAWSVEFILTLQFQQFCIVSVHVLYNWIVRDRSFRQLGGDDLGNVSSQDIDF